jgi:hypothetical protein
VYSEKRSNDPEDGRCAPGRGPDTVSFPLNCRETLSDTVLFILAPFLFDAIPFLEVVTGAQELDILSCE